VTSPEERAVEVLAEAVRAYHAPHKPAAGLWERGLVEAQLQALSAADLHITDLTGDQITPEEAAAILATSKREHAQLYGMLEAWDDGMSKLRRLAALHPDEKGS
jgi:hypothetical protein